MQLNSTVSIINGDDYDWCSQLTSMTYDYCIAVDVTCYDYRVAWFLPGSLLCLD